MLRMAVPIHLKDYGGLVDLSSAHQPSSLLEEKHDVGHQVILVQIQTVGRRKWKCQRRHSHKSRHLAAVAFSNPYREH